MSVGVFLCVCYSCCVCWNEYLQSLVITENEEEAAADTEAKPEEGEATEDKEQTVETNETTEQTGESTEAQSTETQEQKDQSVETEEGMTGEGNNVVYRIYVFGEFIQLKERKGLSKQPYLCLLSQ